ncbi:F-box/LRR-repeat/kelch-repeat protein At2g27520 [Medicago truncatula]|uniref:F-box/LRR-repeat/kelch-repeat protein At2g27520 n=1 Tax=Medicago truncatula TaxID=3880 RepID=UPI000D2F24B4|nr:F-box/LRR-repeat/kelch-repeat protein At2g27520 [Medicago truncatula]
MRYSKLMSIKKKKKDKKNKKLTLSMFLPEELIAQILSLLDVKTILRLICLSKSWNTLISDPTFVQKQLKRPPRLILKPPCWVYPMRTIQSLPITRLLKNPSITVSGDFCYDGGGLNDNCKVVISCNGLLCFIFCSDNKEYHNYWFRIWNPATGTRSKALGTNHDYNLQLRSLRFNFGSEAFGSCYYDYRRRYLLGCLKFTFGCGILSGTYKTVEFRAKGDEENKYGPWRSQLAIQNYFYPFYGYGAITHVDQFKIVSLDLSTEAYMQFSLPSGFDEVPCF